MPAGLNEDDIPIQVRVYESADGVRVVVDRDRRVLPEEGLPPRLPLDAPFEEWHARSEGRRQILDSAPWEPIGLSHDGQTFDHLGYGEAADLLEELAAEGYVIPTVVLSELREAQSGLDATRTGLEKVAADQHARRDRWKTIDRIRWER